MEHGCWDRGQACAGWLLVKRQEERDAWVGAEFASSPLTSVVPLILAEVDLGSL